ncbi:UNVERIFIED_CONTAM: hypothetical protein Sangu_0182600 [Sesamum angustifolium]|uniref:Helitron helicase-like domain-containing protein n=1 Tax=Sesamum angustifolium TaxID=2727405 RepID=A0AAW2RP29_9LAMI
MGVALDENLPAFNQGIYTFRAHGLIYHRIGTLLPPPGMRPRYLQMFIYDTDNELEHRLQESGGLDPELIEKIRQILDAHNPFVKIFRQLAQRADIHDCRLLIREKPATTKSIRGRRITCCDYYAYMLQIEAQKLRWIRFHQNDIRAELYEGLQDCLNAGENNAGNVGRRIILPSSFTGSPRDMYQRYQDAMAIVQKFGPDCIVFEVRPGPVYDEISQYVDGRWICAPEALWRIFKFSMSRIYPSVMASLRKKMAKEEHNPKGDWSSICCGTK